MNVVKDLELFLDKHLSKNIITYKRKHSTVTFIAYREGIVDKNTEAFYLTAIKETDLVLFIKRKISISDILYKAPVLFYAVSSINNKECLFLNKIKYDEIEISNDMKSLENLEKCDKIKEEEQRQIDQECCKKEIYENNVNEYYEEDINFTTDDANEDNEMLLSDDIIYHIDEEEDDLSEDEDVIDTSDTDEYDDEIEEDL